MKSLQLFLFFLPFVSSVCFAQKNQTEKRSIPEDFDPAKTTLLIIDQTNNQTRKSPAYIEEHYTFPHEYATEEEIKNLSGTFADTTKYRFALVKYVINDNIKDFKTGMTRYSQDIIRFHLYDRAKQKDYADLTNGSTIYMMAIKGAIKKLTDEK